MISPNLHAVLLWFIVGVSILLMLFGPRDIPSIG